MKKVHKNTSEEKKQGAKGFKKVGKEGLSKAKGGTPNGTPTSPGDADNNMTQVANDPQY